MKYVEWLGLGLIGSVFLAIGQALPSPVKPVPPITLTQATFSDSNEASIPDGKDFKAVTFVCHPDGTVTIKVDFYGTFQLGEFLVYFNTDDDAGAEIAIWAGRSTFTVARETTSGAYGDVIYRGLPLISANSYSLSLPWAQLFGYRYAVGVWLYAMDGQDRLPDQGELWFLPSECKLERAATPTGEALLIVTPEEFWAPLTRLWYWKRKTGIPTYMVAWEKLQYGRDEAERIKYAIDFYYREHRVRYVMLVGDSEKLPVRFTLRAYELGQSFPTDLLNRVWRWRDPQGTHEERWDWCSGGPWFSQMAAFVPSFFASDLYYADLYDSAGKFQTWDSNANGYFGEAYRSNLNPEGIDLLPDVAVGRVPASKVEEVENYVTKVIEYESYSGDKSWFRKVLIMANQESAEWVECGRKLYNNLRAKGLNPEFYEIPRDQACDNYIYSKTGNGLGFVFYAGHGPWGLGAGGHWRCCDYKLPIVVHIGCDAGVFGPSNLAFGGYTDIYGRSHRSYEEGEHYPCGQLPPSPSTLQPNEVEGSYAEFLTVKAHCLPSGYPGRGAIAYLGATYATQGPAYDLGRFFLEAYARGKLLGQMWREAITRYYREYVAGVRPAKNEDFRGIKIWSWEPWDQYYMIQKFVLFGDPSLRVGGLTQ